MTQTADETVPALDLTDFDASVRVQDDLYRHVNGAWEARTEIPQDKPMVGAFVELRDAAEAAVRDIITTLEPGAPGSEAQKIAETLDGKSFVIIRSASDAGALYGSVTPRDVAEAAAAEGFAVERRQIVLTGPIKELGLHNVRVHLHPEVDAGLIVNVARSPEEAELQATGRSIQDLAAEEDAAAEFEIAELFDDIGSAGRDDDEGAPVRPAVGA